MYACNLYFYCSVTRAKEITTNPREMSKDRCKFTEKLSRAQNTILQPSRANNKTVTQPEFRHVAIQTPCELTNTVTMTIASTQREIAKFKDASSQTKPVKFKDTAEKFKDTSVQRTKFNDIPSQNDIQRYTYTWCYLCALWSCSHYNLIAYQCIKLIIQ